MRAFNMLVLGDSIMWGQGLEETQKFSLAVEQFVDSQLPAGTGVVRQVFAHSGAVIGPDGGDNNPPLPKELPAGAPSVFKQIEMAKSALRVVDIDPKREVDLVLVDGGMNDVSPSNILSLSPFVSDTSVQNDTVQRCLVPWRTLLPTIASEFSAATIVVTAYYPIISELSDPLPVYSWLGGFGLLLLGGAWSTFEVLWHLMWHDKLRRQCLAFDQTLRNDFRQIFVNNPKLALAAARIVFVKVPFAPENCYGTDATSTWLRTFGDQAGSGGVAGQRRLDCDASGRTGFDLMACREASTAHPNIKGAQKYADAIIAALAPFVPQWRARFAPSTQPVKMLAVRIDPPPRIELDKPDSVTVYAADRATGATVQGTYFVGDESGLTGTQFSHVFCRYTKGRVRPPIPPRIDCDSRIMVTAPGYRDQVLVLAIPQAILDQMEPPEPSGPP